LGEANLESDYLDPVHVRNIEGNAYKR
jgi:hypothetical protein